MKKQKKRIVTLIVPAFLLATAVIWKFLYLEEHEKTEQSPCGQYRVEVYRYLYNSLLPFSPGSGSDATGCIYLYRNADNKRILRARLPAMQMGEVRYHRDGDQYNACSIGVFVAELEPAVKCSAWN